ncbi:hypothetical protein [Pectinatus frisingensis]|uniref:hypothetical protein n=1 Tax=Pectinatus frisingensis TaxID=865 RepID=UPI0018C6A3BB|nr:hypothetical protein [Pectinatus frisingensis]
MFNFKTKKVTAFILSSCMAVSVLGTAVAEASPFDHGPDWVQHDSNWQNDHDRQWRDHDQEWREHDRQWREHANDRHWREIHAHRWHEWYKWHHENGDDGYDAFLMGIIAGTVLSQ